MVPRSKSAVNFLLRCTACSGTMSHTHSIPAAGGLEEMLAFSCDFLRVASNCDHLDSWRLERTERGKDFGEQCPSKLVRSVSKPVAHAAHRHSKNQNCCALL